MQGKERPKEPGLRALRTARELQEGMVSIQAFNFYIWRFYLNHLYLKLMLLSWGLPVGDNGGAWLLFR